MVPFPQSAIEDFKKSEEFFDYALEVMKTKVFAYLQVLVDKI